MIKNEEKILKRCLEAVENIADAFCICDTGSTDASHKVANEFLKTHTGNLTVEPWQNFGHNRTASFVNAQAYVKNLGWNLEETYGLLLDADMVFVAGELKTYPLTAKGYKIIQKNNNLEYYNARVIRMDYPWKCIGVTHEYWDGPCENLQKSVCFIDDRNDGGCKHDKFERDAKLLEEGLKNDPDNVRYMFYLAQTYKCITRHADAIKMYKRRIKAGGWDEEIWHSYYSIGECHLAMKNITKFEDWMQRAFIYRSSRVESIYQLARVFRELAHHYKSYQYIKIGKEVPFPKNDALFIENKVYQGLFDYEASIVEYYIHPEKCLRTTIDYMLQLPDHQENCVSNLKFSVKPVDGKIEKLNLPSPFGEDFTPSAISILNYPMANVRYVNYWTENAEYFTKNNVDVQTENAYVNLETNEFTKMIDSSISLPRFRTNVNGLEDIRLFKLGNRTKFTATSVREYEKDVIRVVTGDYDLNGQYENVRVMKSPTNHSCEKNWLPISGTNMFIYSWSPYRIIDSESNVVKTAQTPPLFSLFRGSAPPIRFEDGWLTLVHFVEYSKPRKYYHLFVKHDIGLIPVGLSLPFVFKSANVEYCVSVSEKLECYVSFADKNPHRVTIDQSSLKWISLGRN